MIAAAAIETERLRLRLPQARDWPVWREFAMGERAAHVGGPMDEPKAWRALCHIIGHWTLRGYGSFVLELKEHGRAVGVAGPWRPIDWPEQELAWMIWAAELEGRGLAFEAVEAARRHAFHALGWTTAVSYVAHENLRSIRLAERLGATRDPDAPTPRGEDCIVFRHAPPGDAR